MDIFLKTGKMALGSRLRLLTAKVTEDASRIYELYGVEFQPKWFPVFFILSEEGEKSITEIAQSIGHSQPSVSKIITEMTIAGLVKEGKRATDKRRTVVGLTTKGAGLSAGIRVQCADVDAAIEGILQEATHNLWEAIGEWEYLLNSKSLFARVREQKKLRESKDVRIVDYEPQYEDVFKELNKEWISTYFTMEESDYKTLEQVQEFILDPGGRIFIALLHNEPVGVCALIKMEDPVYDFELAKMAVSPTAKGKNIGWLLGKAAVEAAAEAGSSKVYLESNTILKPAISLYQKLGFRKVVGRATPYARCNIQMELDLKNPHRVQKSKIRR